MIRRPRSFRDVNASEVRVLEDLSEYGGCIYSIVSLSLPSATRVSAGSKGGTDSKAGPLTRINGHTLQFDQLFTQDRELHCSFAHS